MTIAAEVPRTREATAVGARQEPIERWQVVVIGAGVAGRQKRTFMAHAGGAPEYRQKCDEVVALGYEGFVLKSRRHDSDLVLSS
jgi:hypothetical protein